MPLVPVPGGSPNRLSPSLPRAGLLWFLREMLPPRWFCRPTCPVGSLFLQERLSRTLSAFQTPPPLRVRASFGAAPLPPARPPLPVGGPLPPGPPSPPLSSFPPPPPIRVRVSFGGAPSLPGRRPRLAWGAPSPREGGSQNSVAGRLQVSPHGGARVPAPWPLPGASGSSPRCTRAPGSGRAGAAPPPLPAPHAPCAPRPHPRGCWWSWARAASAAAH